MFPLNHTLSYTAKLMMLSVVMLGACGHSDIASDTATADQSALSPAASNTVENTFIGNTAIEKTPAQGHDKSESPPHLAALTMTVYKSPSCGCCSGWVEYMREEGFTVKSVDTDDMDSIKTQLGLTQPELHSCHTAMIDGYVVEGHVPANDVKRLLSDRPDIVGVTAPGMPMMSPGMASRTPKDYNVLAVDELGRTRIWSTY